MSSFADRRVLSRGQYATGANLASRAAIYDYLVPRFSFPEVALGLVEWSNDHSVLDVGCGTGTYLRLLSGRVGRLLGVDASAGMLAGAPHDVGRAVADADALPVGDAAFDRVLSMHMLYHVRDMEAAVRELRRVLCAGGVALVATNASGHLVEMHRAFARAAGDELRTGASSRFGLEDGAFILGVAFESVQRHDCFGELVVPHVEPVVRYMQSTRSFREPSLPAGATWDACMDAFARTVEDTIRREGAFRIRTRAGAFVCR